MAVDISDVMFAVRRTLISNADVTELVKDRIYTKHFYDFDNGTIPMPLVIVDLDSGLANYGGGNQRLTLYIYVYSRESTAECGEIYEKIYTALHAQRLVGDTIKGMTQEISRPLCDYNYQARSYFYRATYLVLAT